MVINNIRRDSVFHLEEVYGAARQKDLAMTKNCQVSNILKIQNPRSGDISAIRD